MRKTLVLFGLALALVSCKGEAREAKGWEVIERQATSWAMVSGCRGDIVGAYLEEYRCYVWADTLPYDRKDEKRLVEVNNDNYFIAKTWNW